MKPLFAAAAALLIATASYAADTPEAAKAPTPAKPFVYVEKPMDISMGKATAPVTVVEYASLSCPHCAHFFNDILPSLQQKYIDSGKVRLVYRDYPLNQPALKAAQVVQCADKERRHEFLTVIFKMQTKWAFAPSYMDSLANIAAFGGLEKEKFDKCTTSSALETAILAVEKEAADDYKIQSTPTFFVNGVIYTGPHTVEDMSKFLDATLEKLKK